MKKQNFQIITILSLITLMLYSCQEAVSTSKTETAEKMATKIDKPKSQERLLRHVVLFKFKASSSEADIERLNKAFHKDKNKSRITNEKRDNDFLYS